MSSRNVVLKTKMACYFTRKMVKNCNLGQAYYSKNHRQVQQAKKNVILQRKRRKLGAVVLSKSPWEGSRMDEAVFISSGYVAGQGGDSSSCWSSKGVLTCKVCLFLLRLITSHSSHWDLPLTLSGSLQRSPFWPPTLSNELFLY